MEPDQITQVSVQTQQLALGDDFDLRKFHEETGLSVKTVKLFSEEYQICYDPECESDYPDDITEHVKSFIAKTKVEIPDKHKQLAKLFDRLGARIGVLNLFHKDPTFQNICTEVELLTPSHLAQMKYLLPEAIHMEMIVARVLKPPKTVCVMRDMKITLSMDVVEADPNLPAFLGLRKVFCQRLVDFCNNNSESCEIPEAELPWPFSLKYQTLPKPLPVYSSIESHPIPIEYESVVSSLDGHSIKRHFPRKILSQTEKIPLRFSPIGHSIKRDFFRKTFSETEKTQLLASLVSPMSESAFSEPPTAPISAPPFSNSSAADSLPVELAPIPRTVTVEMPVQPVPAKRVSDLSSCEKMNIDSNYQTAETKSILADDNHQKSGFSQGYLELCTRLSNAL